MVTLVSTDKVPFQVTWEVAKCSALIKQMLEDRPEMQEDEDFKEDEEPIPIMDRNCTAKNLELVFEYLRAHDKMVAAGASKEEIDAWDANFVGAVDDISLFGLIMATNFLDVKDLMDLACKTVAGYIRDCKTPEEIRARFNIPNDFTPEEEEEARRENAWCEEAP